MSPRLKQYIAATLFCLFVVYITPKEVWHLFASHHDTTHTTSSHTGYPLTLSAAHHHCELMKADQHFSAHDVSLLGWNVKPAPIVWCQQPLAIYKLLPFCKGMGGRGLRAPPVVC